ncbi:MFS transporter [Afifella sp. IM 167]|uniref:MFS transporter n=1 Tax=Afifella sp. IM 167 TaxID=2033586 RepID=UPI001CCD5C68|nr:MFS transporter [Afifella sp. IM 167]MBZ8133368.1 MFS transporter [Afifella sp. IM 167]
MARQLLPIAALLLSVAFLLTANGLHAILLPIRGGMEGFSTLSLGLVGTGWAFGFVASCLAAPRIVASVGHIRAFAAAAAAAAVIVLLNGMWVNSVSWIFLRFFSGFALASCFMIIESWLNERATNENRGLVFGVYMTITYAAIVVGQLLVGAGDPHSPHLFMVGAIFFCLALMPLALSRAAVPQPLAGVKLDLPALFRNSPVAFVSVLLVGVANGSFGTLGPLFGVRIGLPSTQIAGLMSIAIIMGALAQMPAGRISDRLDRRFVIAGAGLVSGLAGLGVALLQPTEGFLLIGLFAVYGAASYTLYSIAVAHANDHASQQSFVQISGSLLLLYGAGTMVGPLVASLAMDGLGPSGLFWLTAVSHFAIAVFAVYRTQRRGPVPQEQRESFAAVPSSRAMTPQTAVLQPDPESIVTDEEILAEE